MTLQTSGPISLGNVAVELGRTSTTTTSLGEAAVRTLAGVASGPVSLSNLYGKSNESFWYATFGSTVVNFLILGTDSSGNIYASASSAVFKWDRDGALIWARNVSGPFINGGWIDASGNVYLAGAYYSSNYYAWLAKLDTSGALQWQRSLNGSTRSISLSMTQNFAIRSIVGHGLRTDGTNRTRTSRSSGVWQWRINLRKHPNLGFYFAIAASARAMCSDIGLKSGY